MHSHSEAAVVGLGEQSKRAFVIGAMLPSVQVLTVMLSAVLIHKKHLALAMHTCVGTHQYISSPRLGMSITDNGK